MKTKINHVFLFIIFALISFTACQDEALEVNNTEQQEIIQSGTELVELMSRTTANHGTMDDILDDASCFSVELPVTIIVSDITIVIETEADLEQLEDVFEDIQDDEDILDFVFPITIIFNDYTEIVIEDEEQLEDFIEGCEDEEEEDIIECVDFEYPISFSVFNSEFNLIETVTIENDQTLYEFIDDLEDDENALIVSLNYPVTLVYANDETIEVNSNEELAQALEAVEDDCDDDDYQCNEDDIEDLLVECPWDIEDENGDFETYQIIFNEDGSLAITEGETTSAIGGAWSLSSTTEGLILNLFDLTAFQEDLGGEWLIVECDDDEIEIVRGDYEIELEQDCEGDLGCSITNISEVLGECAWELETNLIDSLVPIHVYFTPNGQVLINNNDGTESQIGTYELMLIAGDVFIELTLQQMLNELTGQWQIIECEDDELYLMSGNNYIELEQECDIEPNCTQEEVIDYLLSCNIVPTVDDYTSPLTTFQFSEDNSLFTMYQGDLPHNGTWDISSDDNGIFIVINFTPFIDQYYNGQWYLSECDDDGMVFYQGDRELILVCQEYEENPFECFEDAELEVCDQADGFEDGTGVFDLNLIFSDCPNDDVEYSFYLTLADAENEVGALPSPYTNTIAYEQTIYARVSLAGNPSIYEIFEVELEVEDCDGDSCSEEDVDDYLTECIWNAVNYNGSDNLMNWNFDFEENSQIVVIYTDTETIDATWTTSQSNDGVIVTFTNVTGPNIQAITGEWLVVECEENRLELHRGDDILVLERNCD
ncbi:hypothetical protein [uncultured Winogradskyella sp.]|uniref:hypothetical protein n=1 Tax=uncultured Winogradskyella sp. TaxID=395353 RepID=UPI00261A5577|nr:hypothetical protein [uncultured Winogradskyella sp.]